MSEKLIIRNFGPIKDVELELKKINIFIGDQGTGKSSVAKLYSVIKNFLAIKFFHPDGNENLESDDNWQFEQYLNQFEIINYFNDETEIYYFNHILDIEIRYSKMKVLKLGGSYSIYNIPRFTYIVAERVYVSILADALYGLIETGAKLPTLFNRFGNKFSTARKEESRRIYNKLLGVDFTHLNGRDSIVLKDEKVIPLSEGSSGIIGTIPLLVVYDSVVKSIFSASRSRINTNNLMVIEEPELNLFPVTQQKIMNYLIVNNFLINESFSIVEGENSANTEINTKDDNQSKEYKNQLILTTHSPYILTSLNNLMYAYTVGNSSEVNSDLVEKEVKIEKKYWLNPKDVSAYMLYPNGECENIMDETEGLIKAEKIDSITDSLNKEFEALLNIELVER